MASERLNKRLKMLNGAPLTTNLDWHEIALTTELVPAVAGFLNKTVTAAKRNESSSDVKWRHITSSPTRLRSGWSQPYLPQGGICFTEPSFSFSAPNPGQSLEGDAENSTFLETTNSFNSTYTEVDAFLRHSLVFHDTLLSSQLTDPLAVDQPISSSSFLTSSFGTTATGTSSPSRQESSNITLSIPHALTITSLSSLPSPEYLRSIHPQTPTPNLLSVLTSMAPPRDILVRRGNYPMKLQEITVADETDSEFTISFWLRPCKAAGGSEEDPQRDLRDLLGSLKVGDILLLRNIALNIFRNNVYGQSLNPTISRARTMIEVLKKADGRPLAPDLPPTLKEKFEKVKKWASTHVVPDYSNERKRKRLEITSKSSVREDESLPPDTMEA